MLEAPELRFALDFFMGAQLERIDFTQLHSNALSGLKGEVIRELGVKEWQRVARSAQLQFRQLLLISIPQIVEGYSAAHGPPISTPEGYRINSIHYPELRIFMNGALIGALCFTVDIQLTQIRLQQHPVPSYNCNGACKVLHEGMTILERSETLWRLPRRQVQSAIVGAKAGTQ
jgi:hypothetical protein